MQFKSIGVAVDGSETSNIALIAAIDMAKQLNASLGIIHVASKKQAAEEILSKAKKAASDSNLKSEIHLIEGSKRISEQLTNAVENTKSDILVMGTHGHRGFNAFFLGSVAKETICISPVPLLLISSKSQIKKSGNYQKIAAAVDGSKISKMALEKAIDLSKMLNTELALMHVVNERPTHLPLGFHLTEEQDYLKKQGQAILDGLTAYSNENGIIATQHLIEIKTEHKTVSQALVGEIVKSQSDLLVIGTHGWKGLNRFMLGSVAMETIHISPIPILIVRFEENFAVT